MPTQEDEEPRSSEKETDPQDHKFSKICENFINLNQMPIKSEEFTIK